MTESLDQFFDSLAAITEELEQDKLSLSENITTSSALLVSLSLLENREKETEDIEDIEV